MEEPENALKWFTTSLGLQPQYEKARSWRDRVKAEIEAKNNGGTDPGQVMVLVVVVLVKVLVVVLVVVLVMVQVVVGQVK